MAQQILDYVTQRRNVTFAELVRGIEGFGGGDLQIELQGKTHSNIVMWVGLTKAGVDALEELRVGKHIHPTPTSLLTYLHDGIMLKYPLARSIRHYKKPHWAPVVLNPGSH